MTENLPDVVKIGEIIKPHGIEGELCVNPLTDFPEDRFKPGEVLTLFSHDEKIRELSVAGVRWHQQRLLVDFKEITDRNEAEELRDTWVGDNPENLDQDEHVVVKHDLIGMQVRTSQGENRGEITKVHLDEMNPLIEIKNNEEFIDFPLSPDLVESVDRENNEIILSFPDGWKKLVRE